MKGKETFGFIEIVELPEKQFEIRYDGRTIHNSSKSRTNIFFLFGASLFLGGRNFLFEVFNYLNNLISDIAKALEEIGKQSSFTFFNNSPFQEYSVYALHDISSTVIDFLLSFYDESGLDDHTPAYSPQKLSTKMEQLFAIKEKYRDKMKKIEEENSYPISRIKYEEEKEIGDLVKSDVPLPNTLKSNDTFESYLTRQEAYSLADHSSIYEAIEKIRFLFNNLNKISKIVEKYLYLKTIIENKKPILLSFDIANVISEFPDFWKHYGKLVKKEIIKERGELLSWTRSKVSLVEYFEYLYEHKETNDKKTNKKKDRIPWSIIEKAFGQRDLKNSYSSKGEPSKHFLEIKSILKLE
jgi:hypothetical protein